MAMLSIKRMEISLQERWLSRKLLFGAAVVVLLVVLGVFHVHDIEWKDLLNAIVAVTGITIGSMGATDIMEHWSAVQQSRNDTQLQLRQCEPGDVMSEPEPPAGVGAQ